MGAKKFILMFFIGSLFLFLLLPLFNYSVDQWRVLHKDYTQSYKGIEPNKNYLKISYLLESDKEYDKYAFGSSRLLNLDVSKNYENMYNMTYSFGHIKTHLENLKILLKYKKPVKEILLGVDDFYIFKNPKDFDSDYLRKNYPTNLSELIDFYNFYLLKKPTQRDLDIFLEKPSFEIEKHLYITDPSNLELHRKKEKLLLRDKEKHRKYLSSNDIYKMQQYNSNFRTMEAIKYIKEFKNLCDKNNIKLTVFFNPTYYISFFQYNALEIEKFKKELVKITEFHDFFQLSDYVTDDFKWFDPIHFVPSIGDEILKKLKTNENLVTQQNIETHLDTIRIQRETLAFSR